MSLLLKKKYFCSISHYNEMNIYRIMKNPFLYLSNVIFLFQFLRHTSWKLDTSLFIIYTISATNLQKPYKKNKQSMSAKYKAIEEDRCLLGDSTRGEIFRDKCTLIRTHSQDECNFPKSILYENLFLNYLLKKTCLIYF